MVIPATLYGVIVSGLIALVIGVMMLIAAFAAGDIVTWIKNWI
jgi:hypothetical protein